MFLGKGTYGSVRVSKGLAVKKFHDIRHMIQEYVVGSYLDNARNVVRVHEVDFEKLKMGMELYQMNLRHWMEDNYISSKTNDRYFILHEILVGLCEIHGRGLTHGDIKPGNILMNDKPLKVTIGDLGFVSLNKYAKVRYTAKVYRDPKIIQNPSHDLFSLGVVMLELFGKIKIREVCNYEELKKITEERITSRSLKKIISSLVDEEPKNRPSAESLLSSIFNEEITIIPKTVFGRKDTVQCTKAITNMRKIHEKYKLGMIERCIEALKFYIQTHEIDDRDCGGYGMAMLLISSSIYRISKFDFSRCCREGKMEKNYVLRCLCDILANDDIITILLRN